MYKSAEHFKEKKWGQFHCRPGISGPPVLDPGYRVTCTHLTLTLPLPTGWDINGTDRKYPQWTFLGHALGSKTLEYLLKLLVSTSRTYGMLCLVLPSWGNMKLFVCLVIDVIDYSLPFIQYTCAVKWNCRLAGKKKGIKWVGTAQTFYNVWLLSSLLGHKTKILSFALLASIIIFSCIACHKLS